MNNKKIKITFLRAKNPDGTFTVTIKQKIKITLVKRHGIYS